MENPASGSLDLCGTWKLCLEGEEPPASGEFPHRIELPGSLAEAGFGEPPSVETKWTAQITTRDWFFEHAYAPFRKPGNVRVPFLAQARKGFVGAAWFSREMEIPEEWLGRRICLFLERPHIFTTVWVDGVRVGDGDSLGVAHEFELGVVGEEGGMQPGFHTLLIRVDNRLHLPFGKNAHSVSDHTQTNWNGLLGRIELRATSPVWISRLKVFLKAGTRTARIVAALGNRTGKSGAGAILLNGEEHPAGWNEESGVVEAELSFPADSALWDEFDPALHEIHVELRSDFGTHQTTVRFGFRDVEVRGRHIFLNGRRVFFRGTLDCAVFPATGYPPMDRASWEEIFRIYREYGFNHVRFHSWCPPEVCFEVADAMGVYLQVECSVWTRLGEGSSIERWLFREGEALQDHYGNHPSFILLAHGNEPSGDFFAFLRDWVPHFRERDGRMLVTTSGGWPALPENDFDNVPAPRLQAWAEQLDGPVQAMPPSTSQDFRVTVWNSPRPTIAHETGEWCAFPDFRSIKRFKGVVQAGNLEIFRELLDASGLGALAEKFLFASGRLQILLYREEIERALRTPDFAGYQLLQIKDFPGQGSAFCGWLDAFLQSKGYTSPEEFRRFQAPTVLLARFERYVWVEGERLSVALEIAHFGAAPLANLAVAWEWLAADGSLLDSGEIPVEQVAIGQGNQVGTLVLPTCPLSGAEKRTLKTSIPGTGIENSWSFWMVPGENSLGDIQEVSAPFGWIIAGAERYQGKGTNPDVPLVLRSWEELAAAASEPRKILFQMPPASPGAEIPVGFIPIFWNTSWTRKQKPHTLGILCDPQHPALASFPTDCHTDWQWWDVLEGSRAFALDSSPVRIDPIVRWIDDWNTCRSLGLLFEAQVDKASVLFSCVDLSTRIAYRHAARQFRRSILDYLHSPDFRPTAEISMKELAKMSI